MTAGPGLLIQTLSDRPLPYFRLRITAMVRPMSKALPQASLFDDALNPPPLAPLAEIHEPRVSLGTDGYSAKDGVPYWDSMALNTHRLGHFAARPADPYNAHEPVDSSAAAIAAQGFLRLGNYLSAHGETAAGKKYFQAGLTVADTLFDAPYLSTDKKHQGLLLHSVYHRPNGWDHIAKGQKVPNGESSLWGDYHAMELALLIHRLAEGKYYTFF